MEQITRRGIAIGLTRGFLRMIEMKCLRSVVVAAGFAMTLCFAVASRGIAQAKTPNATSAASAIAAPTGETASSATTGVAYVPTMTFDVASVRQSKVDSEQGYSVFAEYFSPDTNRLRVTNFDLANLLSMAYRVRSDQISGLPKWTYPTVFNIEAKCDSDGNAKMATLTKEQQELEQEHAVQALLADRFKLKVHWETKQGAVYNLVVSKAGRLQSTGAPPSAEELKQFGDKPIPTLYQHGDSQYGFHYIAHGATTDEIAHMLAGQFGRPVSDKTGLTGKYDFDLKTYGTRSDDRKDDETNPWPPLETAIQDQLGLKLVPAKGPVPVLVIDHVEMPSPN
jgi:uncharacterized protein (TIGR03435 family)